MIQMLQHLVFFPILLVWTAASTAIKYIKPNYDKIPKWSLWVHHELKPFIPYVIAGYSIVRSLNPENTITGNVIISVMFVIMWFDLKDADDDDRWKKRAQKVLGSVKSLGHRLTVVNQGA